MTDPDASWRFDVTVQRDRRGIQILLRGELDTSGRWRLEEVIDDVAESSPSFMIDCSRLAFIDAAGVGALVRAHALGATVVGAHGRVRRVLELVGLSATLGWPSRSHQIAVPIASR